MRFSCFEKKVVSAVGRSCPDRPGVRGRQRVNGQIAIPLFFIRQPVAPVAGPDVPHGRRLYFRHRLKFGALFLLVSAHIKILLRAEWGGL